MESALTPIESRENPSTHDKSSVGTTLVAFFAPLIGILLFLVNKKKSPLKARSALRGVLFSFGLYCVLLIVFGAQLQNIAGQSNNLKGNTILVALNPFMTQKEKLEAALPDDITKLISQSGNPALTCTSVTLSESFPDRDAGQPKYEGEPDFVGTATFSDGSTKKVEVTMGIGGIELTLNL